MENLSIDGFEETYIMDRRGTSLDGWNLIVVCDYRGEEGLFLVDRLHMRRGRR